MAARYLLGQLTTTLGGGSISYKRGFVERYLMAQYATPPAVDTGELTTLMEPPGEGEGYWTGAPFAHVHDGETYLAVRERDPDRRGRLTIYRRRDGEYESVTDVVPADLDAVSIERVSLVTDPDTGLLKLYVPVDRARNSWRIVKLDDVDRPEAFDPATARTVLAPRAGATDAGTVKDPYVVTVGGRYYMFYAGSNGDVARAHLATSLDGETWTARSEPVLDSQFWHDERTRVSCVIPARDAPVWLVFYDGSGTSDHGSTWNLRTGVAISPDLERVTDVSQDGPVYEAPTADYPAGPTEFAACRYMDVLAHDDEVEVFFEMAREDGSFALAHGTVAWP